MIKIKRAMLSCWNKEGLLELAQGLKSFDVDIISSGGTARFLEEKGLTVEKVESVTGYPEVLNGRVKTLHPVVHAGLLAGDSAAHLADLQKIGAQGIQLVAVNLYPFVDEAVEKNLSLDKAIEFIDIGGPTMLRAAAKNNRFVTALYHPEQYRPFLDLLEEHGGSIPASFNAQQARRVFFYTSWYDAQVQQYLGRLLDPVDAFSPYATLHLERKQSLRYGENPHQQAAAYAPAGSSPRGMAAMSQLWGKPLSFNNYVDVNAAYALAVELPGTAVAIIKHTNPCGAGISDGNLSEAFAKALRGDSLSAFGGIVACNQQVDAQTADKMSGIFFECVIAPGYDEAALEVLKKKKNLRILVADSADFAAPRPEWKPLTGVHLCQDADMPAEAASDWQVVSERQPAEDEAAQLEFAWKVVKHVKSNAIVLIKDFEIYGSGAGQMSRVDSVEIACMKARQAKRDIRGAILASDAFFPFRDGIDKAAAAGVALILQPGGSIRDKEVIAAADEHNMSMIFTGIRHFKH